jgi:CheY-like chemotaxis protein
MNPEPNLVLVVDDDSWIREITATLLENKGFQVVQASNGLEALNLLEGTLTPDAILLDIAMPLLDGIGFRQLQLRNPTIAGVPVIIVTGGETQQLPDLGAVSVLRKPVDPVNLVEELKGCCLRSERELEASSKADPRRATDNSGRFLDRVIKRD